MKRALIVAAMLGAMFLPAAQDAAAQCVNPGDSCTFNPSAGGIACGQTGAGVCEETCYNPNPPYTCPPPGWNSWFCTPAPPWGCGIGGTHTFDGQPCYSDCVIPSTGFTCNNGACTASSPGSTPIGNAPVVPSAPSSTPSNKTQQQTPEMSDYLAMLFVLTASGWIYFLRHRSARGA